MSVGLILAAAIDLVLLHSPGGGGEVYVNAAQVGSLREPARGSEDHFSRGTHCILTMEGGRVIAVDESCDQVRDRLTR